MVKDTKTKNVKAKSKSNTKTKSITTKDNKDFHGFGMKSIKMIVDKYHGDMNITKRNDIFSLNILFASNKIEN